MDTDYPGIESDAISAWNDSSTKILDFTPAVTFEDPWEKEGLEDLSIVEEIEVIQHRYDLSRTDISKSLEIHNEITRDVNYGQTADTDFFPHGKGQDRTSITISNDKSHSYQSTSMDPVNIMRDPELRRKTDPNIPPVGYRKSTNSSAHVSKSQTLSEIQEVFTDSQKIAYVGLCYLSVMQYRKSRLDGAKKALASYESWSGQFMEKLYVYLDVLPEVAHGLIPSDLTAGLIRESKILLESMEKDPKQASLDIPPDIRYTIISHLFLISISDGLYDARSRTILRTMASNLEIPWSEVIILETYIANELRIYDVSESVKHDTSVMSERNRVEGSRRWLYAGLATVAGGALIGVTAGLAAPFIGAGIGAALTTFGLTGTAGIGTFMVSAGGVALITSGGVLTGGGMSGVKMLKRTKGISEFEFLGLDDAMLLIIEHKEKRSRDRKGNGDASDKATVIRKIDYLNQENGHKYDQVDFVTTDILWEANSVNSESESIIENNLNDNTNHKFLSRCTSMELEPAKNLSRQTSVLITISGWVTYDKDDHTLPFSTLERGMNGDQYSLVWESKALQELGSTLSILVGEIASFIFQQGLQATVLPVLMGALTGPLWLLKLTYLVDNPWGNVLSLAEKTGRLLADTLIGQVQSNRPVTLVGFSLGARVIYSCLQELTAKRAHGIIENVYLFGSPVVCKTKDWLKIAPIVSGKIVNGYNRNDMLLGVLYRTSMNSYQHVAGLSEIKDVPGVVNYDLGDIVKGHMEYQTKLPTILKHVGFVVTSETFEDQDTERAAFRAEKELGKQRSKESKDAVKIEGHRQRDADKAQIQNEKEVELSRAKKIQETATEEKIVAQKLKDSAKKLLRDASGSKNRAEKSLRSESKKRNIPIIADKVRLGSEDLGQVAAMESMMTLYWEPKEIKSTLPPLVVNMKSERSCDETTYIRSNNLDDSKNIDESGELSDF